MDTVYIETSVVSHATSWPSADPHILVLQQDAKRWWAECRPYYRVVISQFVLDEVLTGDPTAASDRMALLANVPILSPDIRVEAVANELISRALIPKKAKIDAFHVATAAVAGVEYLLTQNCRHIANAHTLPKVYELLEERGLPRILICTPAEFLGELDNELQSNT